MYRYISGLRTGTRFYLCNVARTDRATWPSPNPLQHDYNMPIKYSLVQRKDMSKGAAVGSKLFYAQAVNTRKVTFEDLCDEIAETCTLTSADIKAVLDRMMWVMVSHLKNSEIIEFADLGNFRITVGSAGSATKEQFATTMIRTPKVCFHPGKRLQDMRTLAKFSRIDEKPVPPTVPPTEVVP